MCICSKRFEDTEKIEARGIYGSADGKKWMTNLERNSFGQSKVLKSKGIAINRFVLSSHFDILN
jgi:hypothetical protein